MDKIIIYSDGGCRGNQNTENVGGWGSYLQFGSATKKIYGGNINTTNNQQELKGAINSLKILKSTHIPVELYIDSAYVVNGMNMWVKGWKSKGWKKGDGKKPENLELWKELDKLVSLQNEIKILKTKGHAGVEGNEIADDLANIAMDKIEAEEIIEETVYTLHQN